MHFKFVLLLFATMTARILTLSGRQFSCIFNCVSNMRSDLALAVSRSSSLYIIYRIRVAAMVREKTRIFLNLKNELLNSE